jgi:hypothetical protein
MHRRAPLTCWIVSIASVESTHAGFVSFVAQFWTAAAVVDEPVAHLSHADAGSLVVVDQLWLTPESSRGFTYTGKDGLLVFRRVGVGNVLRRLVSDVVMQ